MKKKILLFIFLLLMPLWVKADNIYNIKMDIYLNKDGSANITEVWDVKADSGSEWYKQLYNLGNQEVSDYTVMMDGKMLTSKSWNVNEGMSQKAGYYGINYVSEGIELCFGKSDYNRHKFTLNYKMSNFVTNTSDSQIIYQTLFPDATLDNFTVTITSFYEFPDDLGVWGYGGQYLAYVKDGKIELNSDNYKLDNQYVAILVKFPLNTFDTDNYNGDFASFDQVKAMADEGTYDYDYGYGKKKGTLEKIFNFLSSILTFIIPIGAIGFGLHAASVNGYGYVGNKTIDKKETPMFRDIPCNKNIYYANALIKLNNFEYKDTNIFGAILLKWLRQDKIKINNIQKGIFNKDTSVIDMTLNPTFDNDLETELFDIMYKASGDGILEPKELEKWARKNYTKFLNIFEKITDNEIDKLKAANHIRARLNKDECKKKNVMSDMIYSDSRQLLGLKLFLKEFSDMKEKEAIEVKLWDEYLMFAYLFGMADKVCKQFKNLYPEIVKEMESMNMDYGTFVYINSLSSTAVHAASAARSAAESYSGGGGGFSVGGGGGGSFGGGGSMGGR